MATEVAERDEPERRRTGPLGFWREVRAEARKVTWTSRQETLAFTFFVLILVVLAALFFFVTDEIIHAVVSLVLKLAA